jgi:diguanylate cyclase (GGDEF)-like protein
VLRLFIFSLCLCVSVLQSSLAQTEPTNLLKDSSFELNDGSWTLGPGAKYKEHRSLTGKKIVALDTDNSFITQSVVIPKTGVYQVSAWFSSSNPGGRLTISVNGDLNVRAIPRRLEWYRWGEDNLELQQGDEVSIRISSQKHFLNVEDAGLYLQNEAPFSLGQLYPYPAKLADLSREWQWLIQLVLGIFFGLFGMAHAGRRWLVKEKEHSGAKIFTLLSGFATLTISAYLWEVLDASRTGTLLAFYVKYSAYGFFSCYLLFFSLWYCGSRWRGFVLLRTMLLSIAVIHSLLYFTDPWLHLAQLEPYLGWEGFKPLWRESFGLLTVPFNAIFSILQVASLGTFWLFWGRVSPVYRRAIIGFNLGLAVMLPMYFWGGIDLNLFASSIDFGNQDPTPLYLSMGLTFFVTSVWWFRMLEQSPSAWGKAQTDVTEPIVVVDLKHHLVELNSSAKKLLQLEPRHQALSTVVPWLPLQSGFLNYEDKDYQVEVSDIQDISETIGKRVVLHDITELRKVQLELQQANEKLQDQAIKDGLTGLYNRRYLDTLLEQYKTGECSLVLFDIDYFREFNARYGYGGGDFVLKSLAAHLQKQFAYPCRYGGEEFCLVLPDVSQVEAIEIAEKLGKDIAALILNYQGRALTVTVSLGVASLKENGSRLLASADRALQQAKRRGRNRVAVAEKQVSSWGRGWS